MRTDLSQLCTSARERIAVPDFPRASIRRALQAPAHQPARKRSLLVILAAGLSLAAAAAAAEVAVQSHIGYTRSGGMVLSSNAKMGEHAISSDADIRDAASHMNFPVTLPAGLPPGTKAIRLFTAGSDVMAITYDLPGAWRASHHLARIFLANPATLGGRTVSRPRAQIATGTWVMRQARWRVGGEDVILVSNGMTQSEIQAVKRAMQRR